MLRPTWAMFSMICLNPPSLKASTPPASKWPRRVTRSANNPPAHPEDERRRARSGLPAWDIHPKPSLSGVHVTRRGYPLVDNVFDVFSVSHFRLKISIFYILQGPKNWPKTAFWAKSWLPKSTFRSFSGRLSCVRSRLLGRFSEGVTLQNCDPGTVGDRF